MPRIRHLGQAIVLAALTAGLAGQVALAGTAGAATDDGLTVTRASLRGGHLVVAGQASAGTSFITVESTTSAATARPSRTWHFKAEQDGFTAPDCKVVVDDGSAPVQTIKLAGCTRSVQPVGPPAPPTGSCVINPTPAATVKVNQNSVVWFRTSGCVVNNDGSPHFTLVAGVIPTGMSGPDDQPNFSDGNIIGRPTVPGRYRFTVQVQDANGDTDQDNVTVTVV